MMKSGRGDEQSIGEKRNSCRVLVGKPEAKRQLGMPRCTWKIILKRILEK
jgi:hypothetical protein